MKLHTAHFQVSTCIMYTFWLMSLLLCGSSLPCIPFKHTGIVFIYGLAQIGLLILFHAVGLCWGVVFPFHFRRFKAKEKLKYIHITTVLLALFLPTIPALLHLKEGYSITNTPTTVCLGQSVAITFFSLLLPLSVILAVVTSILVTMFWIILKVHSKVFFFAKSTFTFPYFYILT